jgi:hypothetical protein
MHDVAKLGENDKFRGEGGILFYGKYLPLIIIRVDGAEFAVKNVQWDLQYEAQYTVI